MPALHESFENLVGVAKQLNAATDELNEIIAEYERRLSEAGVGLSTWVDTLIDLERERPWRDRTCAETLRRRSPRPSLRSARMRLGRTRRVRLEGSSPSRLM
jgi:hypothetical protein